MPASAPVALRVSPSLPSLVFLMLEIIALILIIGWLLGMVSSYTLGGFIHVLLVVAIIMVLLRLIRGRPGV